MDLAAMKLKCIRCGVRRERMVSIERAVFVFSIGEARRVMMWRKMAEGHGRRGLMSLHHQAGQASRHGKGVSARGRSGRRRHRHRRVRRRRRARSARRMSTPPPCSALPRTRAILARGKLRVGRRLGARAGLGRACRGLPGSGKDRVRIRHHSAARSP